jgi:hypothetical protein
MRLGSGVVRVGGFPMMLRGFLVMLGFRHLAVSVRLRVYHELIAAGKRLLVRIRQPR